MTPKADLLIEGAAQLASPIANSDFSPAKLMTISHAAVASYRGTITAVGTTKDILGKIELVAGAERISAIGMTVTPGLVDCHTHPVFSRTREDEFEMRVLGKSYEDIARSGGGILASVQHLRQTDKSVLVQQTRVRLDRFLSLGTTVVEAKSGYGLTLGDEIKMLEVIRELGASHPIDLVPTFLGAHEIPGEYKTNRSGYIDLVISTMLPRVKELDLAVFCDVFCESQVFAVPEARRILTAARDLGFGLKIHSEQLSRLGGTAMAAELAAVSADHLDYTEAEDWHAMLQNKVVPVVLPGAVFFLRKKKYANARAMWDAGLPVAIATDFNPGSCMTESLPIMMTLACLKLGLTPAEALTAATYHAALAIEKGNLFGSIEVGKKADLVLWDAPNFQHLSYHFGVNLVNTVVKSGVVAHRTKQNSNSNADL